MHPRSLLSCRCLTVSLLILTVTDDPAGFELVFRQITTQLLRFLKHNVSQSYLLSSTVPSTASCFSRTAQASIVCKLQYAGHGVEPAGLLLLLCENVLTHRNWTGRLGWWCRVF